MSLTANTKNDNKFLGDFLCDNWRSIALILKQQIPAVLNAEITKWTKNRDKANPGVCFARMYTIYICLEFEQFGTD